MSAAAEQMPVETPLVMSCGGCDLVGIVHESGSRKSGIVCVAGGGQYRVGSHRLYVQLARRWAAAGHAVLRFDQRGVGDSDGRFGGFENTLEDITEAVDRFRRVCPDTQRTYLFGLCDSAAAVLMAAPALQDLGGLVLVNPWVHSSDLEARTRLSRYYTARLRSRDFWSKLSRGKIDLGSSARSLLGYVREVAGASRRGAATTPNYVRRMLQALATFEGEILVVLSGQDLVAQQFRQLVAVEPEWRSALDRANVTIVNLESADYTFSRHEHRELLEKSVLDWLP